MIYGHGKYILYVDLSSGEIRREQLSDELVMNYLGGRGVNARLLWDLVPRRADPLGPDNVIIFGTGVVSGTHSPSSGRTTVSFKSPATGLYAKSSGGGHFGPSLKLAGYSHLVIRGRADHPVYLAIHDQQVEIRDASHLWGLPVPACDEAIRREMGGDPFVDTVCIGPAGENKVAFAAVMMSVHCAAARAGGGAVMGAKNLKGIGVLGAGCIPIYDPAAFGRAVDEAVHDLTVFPSRERLRNYGTAALIKTRNDVHMLPACNWKHSHLPEAEKVSTQYLTAHGFIKKATGCGSCATGCHRSSIIPEGPYQGTHSSGPEYETSAALGVGCGINDPAAVLRASALCNEYGMDVISAGGVVQWAMECYERGLISREQCQDAPLEWGNGDTLVKMMERIAFRRGIGDVLALGVRRAAEVVGGDSWQWANHVKGLEYSRAEIRCRTGYALALAVNPRGGDHLHSQVYAEFGANADARALIKKICGSEDYCNCLIPDKRADIVRWHEDCYVVSDSMGLCTFSTLGHGYKISPERMAEQFSAATGHSVTARQMLEAGRRVINLERSFNVREGAGRRDDHPSYRFFHDPITSGEFKGMTIDKEMFEGMLDDYYRLHGWELTTGRPTAAALSSCGLTDVSDELARWGCLGGEDGPAARQ